MTNEVKEAIDYFKLWEITSNPYSDAAKFSVVLIAEIDRLTASQPGEPGTARCPECGSERLTRQANTSWVECQSCNETWSCVTVADFAQFFRPPAPSPQPPWVRQESCSECDGDGCAKCQTLKDRIAELLKLASGDEDGPSDDQIFDYVKALLTASRTSGVAPSGSAGPEPPYEALKSAQELEWFLQDHYNVLEFLFEQKISIKKAIEALACYRAGNIPALPDPPAEPSAEAKGETL